MAICKLGEILNQSDPGEALALTTAINHKYDNGNYIWSAKALSNAVNKTRFSVGATTIKEHRNQACGCA